MLSRNAFSEAQSLRADISQDWSEMRINREKPTLDGR